MRETGLKTFMLALILGVVAAGGRAAAAAKPALPASVVQTVDGVPVALNDGVVDGQWLVLYVVPDSPPSVRLLDALRTWQVPALDRVLVVVGGPAAPAATFARAQQQRGLDTVRWRLDGDRAAWTDLAASGVPTLFGVRAGVLEWRLAGVLNDPSALQSVVASWLSTTAP
ncbi:MAG: hypothetical protein JSU08_10610 [Acidobacteria bacterium]|nr:hypothetical protein [Acidobacteriota bacterium]